MPELDDIKTKGRALKLVDADERCAQPDAQRAQGRGHEESLLRAQLSVQRQELSRAHDELRRSRERHRELFDLVPVAYLAVAPDFEILAANQAASRLLARPVEDLLRQPLDALFADGDAGRLELFWRLVFGSGGRQSCELNLAAGAEHRPVQLVCGAPTDESGERSRAYTALLDLSEARRAQAALRLSRDRFRSLFESSGGGVIVLRGEGPCCQISEANEAICGLLGYASGSLIGRQLELVAHPEDRSRLTAALRAARASPRQRIALEVRLIRNDCETVWVHLTASWVCDEAGRPQVAVGLLHDITDRKRAENALREAEARQRAILTAAADGIVTVDDDGIIESLNPAAGRILGCSFDEAIGREIYGWIPELTIRDLTTPLPAESIGAPVSIELGGELQGRRRDGTTLPLHVATGAIQVNGRRAHCIFLRDLTVTKQTERALRHAERMEAVGTLAAGVAHDFNNVLMGIAGLTTVALEAAGDGGPLRMYLEEIARSTQSGATITRQLLELSRKRDAQPEVFEIDEHVNGQRAMLASLLGANVTLELRLGAPAARVCMDPAQLDQIVYNLASNARDAMPEGGTLVISTEVRADDDLELAPQRRLAPDARPRSYVVLSVGDTGCGMSDEVAARAFEPFFSSKQAGCGIGVGLFTVHGAVARAGGAIDLVTAEGEGTRLDIVLPRATTRITRSMPKVTVADTVCRGATVVVVEDDALVRMTVRYYLEQRGCRVLEAHDAREALECCRRFGERIDLMLGDIVLPDGSGERISRQIQLLRPEMRILLMSAYSHDQLITQSRLSGSDRVLQKPFSSATLIAAVSEVLAQGRPGEAEGVAGADGSAEAKGDGAEQPRAQDAAEPLAPAVLVVEDQSAIRLSVCAALRQRGFRVFEADSGRAAMAYAREKGIAAMLVDVSLPDVSGVELAGDLRELHDDAALVVMSAYSQAEVTRKGPLPERSVFVHKPVSIAELVELVEQVIAEGGSKQAAP